MPIRTLKIALLGLTLSGAAAGAAAPRAPTRVQTHTSPAPRTARRPPQAEGCFVPPPELVVVAPCDSERGVR